MPRQPITYRFNVRIPTRTSSRDVTGTYFRGFLDMLRFDGAVVLSHSLDNDAMIVNLQTNQPPTLSRWASVGLPAQVVN